MELYKGQRTYSQAKDIGSGLKLWHEGCGGKMLVMPSKTSIRCGKCDEEGTSTNVTFVQPWMKRAAGEPVKDWRRVA